MRYTLFFIIILTCALFAQKKYLTTGDSILVYGNTVTEASWVSICIKDSNDSSTDTLVVEQKNPFGNWVQIGCKGIYDWEYYSILVPGNATTKYYLPLSGRVSPGEIRLRKTNAANRTRKTQASIERRSFE